MKVHKLDKGLQDLRKIRMTSGEKKRILKYMTNKNSKNIVPKLVLAAVILSMNLVVFHNDAEAQSRSRYSSRTSTRSSAIRNLEKEDEVEDLKIPILFGVAVRNLFDSWGDARSGGREHEGIDILAPRGQFIVSPTDAVVVDVDNGGNGGKNVSTINPGGERYYYAHLDDYADDLSEGDVLKPGDLIGYVGNTGNAAGGPTHLHFGIYRSNRGGATNPFPRLTEEFSSKQKAEAFVKILNDADDSEELAVIVVSQNKDVFIEALAQGVKLPASISEILVGKRTEVLGVSRVLQVGMNGEDVKALQAALGVTADGDFGPKTRTAVMDFQRRMGQPADGVFGVATRLALANSSLVPTALPEGCTSTTAYSVTTGAKCVPTIVIPLPAGCTTTTTFSPTTGAKCRP